MVARQIYSVIYTLAFQETGTLMFLSYHQNGLWKQITPKWKFLFSCFQTTGVHSLCSVCIRGSDVVGSGEGSAKQGEMEKKAKLNRRDRQPLQLLLLLHFHSHVHICFPGLRAEGRSILNLVPHPAVFPNFFWLSVYYSNSAVLLWKLFSFILSNLIFDLLSSLHMSAWWTGRIFSEDDATCKQVSALHTKPRSDLH